jgi:hypothetical protein
MSVYTAEHAGAAADVRSAGAPVVWTMAAPSAYDAATGLVGAPTVTEIAGYALRTRGNPARYRELGLVETEAPTFLFVAATFGALPALGGTMRFGGHTYTARDIEPLAPDGVAILARVVAQR